MLRNVHQNKVLTLKEFDLYQKILDILGVRRNYVFSSHIYIGPYHEFNE